MSTVCWPCHYGGIVYADSDNTVRYIRMDDLKKTTGLIMHHANVWVLFLSFVICYYCCSLCKLKYNIFIYHIYFVISLKRIAASYYHPFVASCSADGSVKIANICRLRDRHQVRILISFPIYDQEKCAHLSSFYMFLLL